MTAPLDDQVAALFPLGGPHDDATTVAAARSIAGLVRYLNHATRHVEAVSEPATVDAVVHSLAEAMGGLDQLLRQIGDRLKGHLERPGVYATGDVPVDHVALVVQAGLYDARTYVERLRERLAVTGGYTSRIGLDGGGDE